jgi:2-isopropylmalate synthase
MLADKKKDIYDDDLRAIVTNEMTKAIQVYQLVSLQIMSCSRGIPSSAITIKKDDKEIVDASIGEGTVDAIFKTIDRISGYEGKLMEYRVTSVSEGKDALANVTVKVKFNDNEPAIIGHGINIDTMLASARAYISALNSYLSMEGLLKSRSTQLV